MNNLVPGGSKGLLFYIIAGALIGFGAALLGLPGWLIGAIAGITTPMLAKIIQEKVE